MLSNNAGAGMERVRKDPGMACCARMRNQLGEHNQYWVDARYLELKARASPSHFCQLSPGLLPCFPKTKQSHLCSHLSCIEVRTDWPPSPVQTPHTQPGLIRCRRGSSLAPQNHPLPYHQGPLRSFDCPEGPKTGN